MISLKYGLPLVRGTEGKASAFDCAWLRSTLASAAVKAGYQGWWLVDDLVEGISTYLRHDYPSGVIDLWKLEHVVRAVLNDVGYKEVAARFRTVMPCHRVSLVQCLRQLSQNDRTEFFDHLGALIVRLKVAKVRHIHFSDLHACVRSLTKIHSTAQHSEDPRLLCMVVAFVRDRIQELDCHPQVWCSIS